uniref:Uncharacterized protein n=1 Tax=Escherichia coli TaxID=562 RepID=A0A6M4P478_ECOLX|nr:hypothetical protein G6850_00045 [Escherichia coli]
MPFAVLALAIVMTFFTILSYETGKQATRTEERVLKREADDVASQMMSLSQALTHWRWKNPSATALPAVSTLGLPFSTPDSRIGYALSGGRCGSGLQKTAPPVWRPVSRHSHSAPASFSGSATAP